MPHDEAVRSTEGPAGGLPQLTLRDPRYLRLLALCVALTFPAALITVGFIKAYTELIHLVWTTLPDQIGVSDKAWLALVIAPLAGALVGLVVRYAPGHAGQDAGAGHGVGGDERTRLLTLPGVAVTAFVSLTGGASLGPEAPLMTIVGSLGRWTGQRLKLPREAIGIVTLALVASVFGGIFGSPVAAAVLVLEVVPLAGAAVYPALVPALVSATIGYYMFVWVLGAQFAAYHLPAYVEFKWVHLLDAALVGAVGAVGGMAVVYAYRALHRGLRLLDRNLVARGALGGLGLAVTAIVAGDLVLFSGEHELQVVIDRAGTESVGTLLLLAAGKVVATSVCMATGFRGGRIFPAVFVGGTLGVAVNVLFPSMPLALTIACGMTAAAVAVMRLPIFAILFISFFVSPEVVPLMAIAGVVALALTYDQPDFQDAAAAEDEDR